MHFLVIEDDQNDRIYLQSILRDYEVDVVSSPDAADFDLSTYDFIICDFFVNGGDNFEFLKKLSERGKDTPTVIIIISGFIANIPVNEIPKNLNAVLLSKNESFKELLHYHISLFQDGIPKNDHDLDYKTLFFELCHDLKNDLTLVQVLKDDFEFESEKEEIEILRKIGQSSKFAYQRLLELTEYFNDEIEKYGSIENALEMIESSEILKETIQKVRLTGDTKKYVKVIPKYFLSVILKNLIENSQKYSLDDESLEISINIDVDDVETVIKYEDNGKGMSPEKMDKLFQKKQQGHSTGIGLIILKRIINNFGGKIIVTSEIGKGTQMTINFAK